MKILTLKNKLHFVPLKADCLIQCCSRDALWGPKCWEPHNLTLRLHQNCHVSVTPAGWHCPRSTTASPYALSFCLRLHIWACLQEPVCSFSFWCFDVFHHQWRCMWSWCKISVAPCGWMGGWVTCGDAGGRQVCVPDESRGKQLPAELSFGRKCAVLVAVCCTWINAVLCLAS